MILHCLRPNDRVDFIETDHADVDSFCAALAEGPVAVCLIDSTRVGCSARRITARRRAIVNAQTYIRISVAKTTFEELAA